MRVTFMNNRILLHCVWIKAPLTFGMSVLLPDAGDSGQSFRKGISRKKSPTPHRMAMVKSVAISVVLVFIHDSIALFIRRRKLSIF